MRPNGLVGLILLLFFVLPGVLYFILAGKHVRSTVAATAAPEGCHILIGGESRVGYNELNRWLKKLPRATSGEVLADVESVEAVSVPDQLRELAELRDAGIVTQVEFEAKKAELLKRM